MTAPIALLTDFGSQDTYVGVMKGVIAGIAPGVPVIDVTHGIPAGDIRRGAFDLWQAEGYFPQGTIFVAVIDPGVGTERRGAAVAWKGKTFILPDNGLLSYLLAENAPEAAHALQSPEYQVHPVSRTFHGRDVFAPAAAHRALGVPLESFGPSIEALVRLPLPQLENDAAGALRGEILHADRFGNLITSIGRLRSEDGSLVLEPWLPGVVSVRLSPTGLRLSLPDDGLLPFRRTFGEAAPGEALAYVGSEGLVEIAVNRGSAAEQMSLGPGVEVTLEPAD